MIKLIPNKKQFQLFIDNIDFRYPKQIDLRKSMFNKLNTIDFPTKRSEDWRFTDLSHLLKTEYKFNNFVPNEIPKNCIDELEFDESNRIVLVNGKLKQKFSNIDSNILNITTTNENDINVANNSNPFLFMNGALYNGGYQLNLNANYSCEKPMHILNIISNDAEYVQQHHLNKINIGPYSQITIIEEIIYLQQSESFSNIVSEIQLDDNSSVNYTLIQDYHSKVKQFNHHLVAQADNSNLEFNLINIGGNLIRNDLKINLSGENCSADIAGINLLTDNNHIENYLSLNHIKPNSTSKQIFKYILNKKSHGVFNGLVNVHPKAQKSDTQQTNKNILLSKDALMNANPQLQIEADDVKCAHGSATGELDQDAIFYMRSRGIDLSSAKALLLAGFAKEIFDKVPNETINNKLNDKFNNWLKN